MFSMKSARRGWAVLFAVLMFLGSTNLGLLRAVEGAPLAEDQQPWKAVLQGNARPMFAARVEDEKLPPVNWIRSRTIDTKHIAIDLKFDWDKKQALGIDTITVAPFNDTDRFTLDAAQMTISSITTVDGKPL